MLIIVVVKGDTIAADDIVEAVLKGFKAGEEEYGLTARVILCCICGLDQFSEDLLRLCVKYRKQGVVGMDVAAGDGEGLNPEDPDMFNSTTMKVFTDVRKQPKAPKGKTSQILIFN